MSTKTIITCDNPACEADLTESAGAQFRFRLALSPEHIPLKGGASAIHAPAPLDRIHHFCDFKCVGSFANIRQIQDREAAAATEKQ